MCELYLSGIWFLTDIGQDVGFSWCEWVLSAGGCREGVQTNETVWRWAWHSLLVLVDLLVCLQGETVFSVALRVSADFLTFADCKLLPHRIANMCRENPNRITPFSRLEAKKQGLFVCFLFCLFTALSFLPVSLFLLFESLC